MIKIEDVTYRYKKGRDILEKINLTIKDEETVVIIGKNGSGKSTLGKLISGIIQPKEGKILIDDLDIADKKNKEEIRKKIGIVFQNPENQIIFNRIQDELSFALKDLSQDEVKERIEKALQKVHMENKINEDLYDLSLGQKQRIIISEALAKQPKYIVFDEPTTMIDSKGKEEIHHIIEELKKDGYTIIYITNMAEEMLLADRIIILDNGKIVEEIPRQDFLNKLDVLEQYEMKIPFLLETIRDLKKEGIEIDLEEYSVREFVTKLKEIVKR